MQRGCRVEGGTMVQGDYNGEGPSVGKLNGNGDVFTLRFPDEVNLYSRAPNLGKKAKNRIRVRCWAACA